MDEAKWKKLLEEISGSPFEEIGRMMEEMAGKDIKEHGRRKPGERQAREIYAS